VSDTFCHGAVAFRQSRLTLLTLFLLASGFAAPDEHPVTAELIAEHASIQAGSSTRVGVHFELEEGWHIYAKDPGEAGLPTQITWSVPTGVSVGDLQWPAPQHFIDPGDIKTFGYSGALVLGSLLTYHTGRAAYAEIPIQAQVKWLACKELCIPGAATLSLTLPVSSSPPVPSTHAELFEHTP